MINQNFVILGVLLQLIGAFPYIKETIQGKIQPNKVSWIMWSIAPLVAFAAEISQGVGILSLATFVVGFVPILVLVASFFNKKAEWQITKFDLACGFLSFMGLTLWYITKVGNVAIFFCIFADFLASLPTIVKSFTNPESENASIYLLGLANPIIALLVIRQWNFKNFGFPLYLLLDSMVIAFLVATKFGKKIKFSFAKKLL